MKSAVLLFLAAFSGCTVLSQGNSAGFLDFIPPQLEAWSETEGAMKFRFDENLAQASWRLEGDEQWRASVQPGTAELTVTLPADLEQGCLQKMVVEVLDGRGNRNLLMKTFYPWNPRAARLRITEAAINGTRQKPDMVELLVLEDGSLAGLEIRDSAPGTPGQSLVLPEVEVTGGQRILIHFKSDGQPGEIQETETLSQSVHPTASPSVRDFWVPEGTGLSGTNGVILVFERPGGGCLDALAYSNRSSDAQDRYGGFGSRQMQENLQWCGNQGIWRGPGALLTPEDCVPSGGTTSLRTLCRTEGSDTDQASDWFISQRSSLGGANPGLAYGGRSR